MASVLTAGVLHQVLLAAVAAAVLMVPVTCLRLCNSISDNIVIMSVK
jgi:hypothetical protein